MSCSLHVRSQDNNMYMYIVNHSRSGKPKRECCYLKLMAYLCQLQFCYMTSLVHGS
jgi:hypothetical protein